MIVSLFANIIITACICYAIKLAVEYNTIGEGAVVPLLPAFPFLLLATVSFAKSSQRLHTWFVNTKLYKINLESYVKGHGMTWKTKICVMLTVTRLMSVGLFLMFYKNLFISCAILGGVWLFHIIDYVFGVKKYNPEK